MEGLKASIDLESRGRKCFIATAAIIATLSAATIGGIYLTWMVNVNNIQSAYKTLCEDGTCTDD